MIASSAEPWLGSIQYSPIFLKREIVAKWRWSQTWWWASKIVTRDVTRYSKWNCEGNGEKAQQVRCLPWKPENLRWDPKSPNLYKLGGYGGPLAVPVCRKIETEILAEADKLDYLRQWAMDSVEKQVLTFKMYSNWGRYLMSTFSMYTHAHTYLWTHKHTGMQQLTYHIGRNITDKHWELSPH